MDASIPVFLSIVCVVRNQSGQLHQLVEEISGVIGPLVIDYEIILVDNASDDGSISIFQTLTAETGLPNVQVYALAKEVERDTASWVGVESALGDFVAIIDPQVDDVEFLPTMLEHAVSGNDVVFARNEQEPAPKGAYRVAQAVFNRLYKHFNGIHLAEEAPQYRLLSKRVVNFVQQHAQPELSYRHLPASGGFKRSNLRYDKVLGPRRPRRFGEGVERGIGLLVSTTRAPMRVVTSLSLFGAVANLGYSLYVLAVWLFKPDVEPGWVSLSLQQSGMFLLFSLVLLVLGEYILHMVSLSSGGPLYHVAQEFTSARLTRRERLNVKEISVPADEEIHELNPP